MFVVQADWMVVIKDTPNVGDNREDEMGPRIGRTTRAGWFRMVLGTLAMVLAITSVSCSEGSTTGSGSKNSSVHRTEDPDDERSEDPERDKPNRSTIPPVGVTGSDLVDRICEAHAKFETLGTLSAPQIIEASGLAASRSTRDVWWTHNDSGGEPELYAIHSDGRLLAVLHIEDAEAKDWEDIAVAVDPSGVESIYVADTGDGTGRRDHVTIYKVTAPDLPDPTDQSTTEPVQLSAEAVAFDFAYPDGPRDAEALIVDSEDESVYIIDKDMSFGGNSNVYRGSLSAGGLDEDVPSPPTMLQKIRVLNFRPATLVTAADLSPDGTALAVRAYGAEYLYHRRDGQSISDALAQKPCIGPLLPERQGEAIAFSATGDSYVTLAEGAQPTLHSVVASE